MSVTLYTPNINQVVHDARIDFVQRYPQPIIRIVQYDKSLPIVAVKLYNKGVKYVLPPDANVNIRWGKRDHTFSYNAVLGCNEDRTVVYFEITEQMTIFNGEHAPILELKIGTTIAGSEPIYFYIDRNPIQNEDIESHVETGAWDALLKKLTVTILASDWILGVATITATGVTANNIVWVSPDLVDSEQYWSNGVRCTAQTTDSLSFACDFTPTVDLDVNLVIGE